MPGAGHNSEAVNGDADDRLRLMLERIERFSEEKQAIADDVKDVFAEAKAVGYDTKIMREVIKLRKMARDDLAERDMLLGTYRRALGLDFV